MRPTLPLCCTLLAAACLKEPPSGTFVGNPGTLQLTTARTSGFAIDSGATTLGDMSVLACDSGPSTAVDLTDVVVRFDGTQFTTDPPVQIPEGTWCGLELSLDTLSFDVQSEATQVDYQLDFDDISVRVTGPELVIEGQTFALQLARNGWLSILDEQAPDGTDPTSPVQVRETLPETWEALRLILTDASALSFAPDPDDPANGATEDGQFPADGGDVLWGGTDRPPDPTTPNTPTTSTQPPRYDLVPITFVPAIGQPDPTQRPSIAILDPLVAIVYGDTDLGINGVVASLDGPIAYGDAQALQRPGTRDPHVAATPNGFQLVSADQTTIYVDDLSPDAQLTAGPTLPSANASFPTNSGGTEPLIAWLEADVLRIASVTDPAINTSIAEGVRGRFSMASGPSAELAVAWVEDLPNPLTGGVSERLYIALFSTDGTTQLIPVDAGGPSDPRVSVSADRIAVAYDDDGQGVVQVFGLDGEWLASPALPDQAHSVDVVSTDTALVVAYVDQQQVMVSLFSSVGVPLSDAFRTELIADQIDVDASDDPSSGIWIAVAASQASPDGLATVLRAELVPGR